jgi:hypothetical protein
MIRRGHFVRQGDTRDRIHPLRRQPVGMVRQGLCLADRPHGRGDRLRGLRPLRHEQPDRLGARRVVHHVRHALHDGRRLHAVARRACPGRLPLPALAAPDAGQGGPRPLHPLLLPRRLGADLRGLEIRRALLGLRRGLGQQPGGRPDLPVQDGDRRRGHPSLHPGHRAGLPLHPRDPHERMARRRRGRLRDRGPPDPRSRKAEKGNHP